MNRLLALYAQSRRINTWSPRFTAAAGTKLAGPSSLGKFILCLFPNERALQLNSLPPHVVLLDQALAHCQYSPLLPSYEVRAVLQSRCGWSFSQTATDHRLGKLLPYQLPNPNGSPFSNASRFWFLFSIFSWIANLSSSFFYTRTPRKIKFYVKLACVKAHPSVHSEPESNSWKQKFWKQKFLTFSHTKS